jgi:hypothetical protein
VKKTFALAACVLIGGVNGALAKGGTTISLNGFCDVLTIHHNKVLKTALAATDDPNCEALYGAGFVGKVKVLGNSAVIGMHVAGAAEEFVFRIDYPFVTGGSWVLYGTQDGVNLMAFAGDTYTVNGTPAHGAKPVSSAIKR